MKSNDVEKNKLVELLKKQHTGKLIFECKQRVALRAINELVAKVSLGSLKHDELDKYMEVVNELFKDVDINSKWLEVELEALDYFSKFTISFDLHDKETLIEKVNIAKAIITGALSRLK